ncbi:MAG: hypothetical protein RLZZ292_1866, partial [Bacteroidota bacterium]
KKYFFIFLTHDFSIYDSVQPKLGNKVLSIPVLSIYRNMLY